MITVNFKTTLSRDAEDINVSVEGTIRAYADVYGVPEDFRSRFRGRTETTVVARDDHGNEVQLSEEENDELCDKATHAPGDFQSMNPRTYAEATGHAPFEPMKTEATRKEYLGDSVYAEFDGFAVTLTTENGIGASNLIFLEPEVLSALDTFRNALKPKIEDFELPDSLGAAIKGAIQGQLESAEWVRRKCTAGAAILARVASELSQSVEVNAYGGTFWITVSKREDVQVVLKLAPMWNKNAYEGGVDYNATVDGVEFKIRTTDGALPPTCKLVEKDVEIPAEPAKPARIEKRMVVECVKVTEAQS